jgi:hypothetical protein
MATQKTHLWLEEPVESEDSITLSTIIESPKRGRSRLWYRIPNEFSGFIGSGGDPFVIGNIFLIMGEAADCEVHAHVSTSLLKNLTEFQSAWASWRPDKYRQVEITSESEGEDPANVEPGPAVAAFTGGVDSCFTMYRHRMGLCDRRWQRDLEAGLLVHGFDIPLEQEEAFERAAARTRQTLASVGARLITMATNLQSLNIDWDDTHIAGVASCLMLLKGRYSEGLVPSGHSYRELPIPCWGSNPVTDHLLSSYGFRIVHDGAGVKRNNKIRTLANWSEGFENLRICYSAERRDENCGQCMKCSFLTLGLRIAGIPMPASLPELSDNALSKLTVSHQRQVSAYQSILRSANKAGIRDSWVSVLSQRVRQWERQLNQDSPRPRFRFFF